ncbi:uncharacterized protein [Mytilus edulis]|uniref:uncharacterized protein n=1 Tax=Mytilus edulis TaxID=6550 RepID=UPI0039EF28A8
MMYSDEQSRYSDVMRVCNQIIISSAEPILKCIETLCNHFEDDVIVIADYCTADGGNSVEILHKMKEKLDEHSRQMFVIFEDHPNNDFSCLFNTINCKHNQHNMYQAVCSKDMYKQCLPSNFIHLIFSTFGYHWLSERPCNIENGMFVHDANESEQKEFAQQAEKDWETFLLQRGKELKRGGIMYLLGLVKDDKGEYGSLEFHKQLSEVQKKMFQDGFISKEEHKNMLINFYQRSDTEMRLPFCQGSNVSALGLKLQSFTTRNWTAVKHPGNENNQEKQMWASCMTSVARVWSHKPMIESFQNHRTMADKMNLMNRFYDNLKTRLLECTFDLDYTIVDLIITKT